MMTKTTIPLPRQSPYDITARGRNGWFRPAELTVYSWPPLTPLGSVAGCAVELTVSSKTPAQLPPQILRLDPASARALAAALVEAAEQIPEAPAQPTPQIRRVR